MKRSEVFPSRFIKSEDLMGREVLVVISDAQMEEFKNDDGQTERKLVLHFQHKEKGMVCNMTNYDRISEMYGEDTDGWIGKEVCLYTEKVRFGSKTTMGIRIKASQKRNGNPAPVQQAPVRDVASHDGDGEEIPF